MPVDVDVPEAVEPPELAVEVDVPEAVGTAELAVEPDAVLDIWDGGVLNAAEYKEFEGHTPFALQGSVPQQPWDSLSLV